MKCKEYITPEDAKFIRGYLQDKLSIANTKSGRSGLEQHIKEFEEYSKSFVQKEHVESDDSDSDIVSE